MRAEADLAATASRVPPALIAVVGPTASGKSALATALAEAFGGEIVNCDSMQVYRHFDIGTAKPSREARGRVPHHLIDLVEPDEHYSAGRYATDAQAALGDICARGRLPIVCGGTGLYLRALLFGLAPVPPVNRTLQAQLNAELARRGARACHADLSRIDPHASAAIHPNDPVRIARALAVYHGTGRPLSAYQREQPFRARAANAIFVGYRWERAAMYDRVNQRVRRMLARGWVEEVRGLLDRGYGAEVKPMRAIGYREIVEYITRGSDEGTLADRIAMRTRRYAKRQLTWLRNHPDLLWAEPGNIEPIVARVKKHLKRGPADR